jgi:CheY-like chemotaxis protein
MNCPRCRAPITAVLTPDAMILCPGCGAKLMTRSSATRSQGGTKPAAPAASPPPAHVPKERSADDPPTLPSAPLPPTPRTGLADGEEGEPAARRPRLQPKVRQITPRPAAEPAPGEAEVTLSALLAEVRAVRETQERILELLEPMAPGRAAPSGGDGPALAAVRSLRRKSVVLIDDDPKTREAVLTELQQADVPVRAFDTGNGALQGIAEEKPDVIALELGLGGDMGGKDIVNLIKATMEWVDIPIVLWTRESVANQREARQIHGADELIPKSSGAAALAARIITLFRQSGAA